MAIGRPSLSPYRSFPSFAPPGIKTHREKGKTNYYSTPHFLCCRFSITFVENNTIGAGTSNFPHKEDWWSDHTKWHFSCSLKISIFLTSENVNKSTSQVLRAAWQKARKLTIARGIKARMLNVCSIFSNHRIIVWLYFWQKFLYAKPLMADLLCILHLSLIGMGLTYSSPSLSFLPLPNSASGKREIRNLMNFAEELWNENGGNTWMPWLFDSFCLSDSVKFRPVVKGTWIGESSCLQA